MSNETIFREVDEELRGDRLRALWKRFGPYVMGGAVAVVLVVAANEGWSWWQSSNAARSSDQFYAALELAEAGDIGGAQAALDQVTTQGSGGYPTLARFRQASLLARDGKRAEAIAAYDALATSETNPRLRELALALSAYLLVDDGDVAAVEQRVVGLAAPENPMRNAAREAIGLTQYKAGDLDGALATLEQILADPMTGEDLRGRIQIYVAQLVAQGARSASSDGGSAAATGDSPAAAEPPVVDAPAMDVVEPVPEVPQPASDVSQPVPEVPQPDETAAPADDAPAAGEASGN